MIGLDLPAGHGRGVVVAMSGGVDSSVAAALLRDRGYKVLGVTMCFRISHRGRRPSCCGAEGIADARRAAERLGIPHYVQDFAEDLSEFIIEDFVAEYRRGRTPNPCARCNRYLKFGSLLRRVGGLSDGLLATGHYARISIDPGSGERSLCRAVDRRKDQSYFLYGIPRTAIDKILFPLGGFRKEEVRGLAAAYGLDVADKAESQDVCFIPETGYRAFVGERLGPEADRPGPFLDPQGRVVGRHRGIWRYTVGQREGLGLALGSPVYVYRIDPEANAVHVGPKDLLFAETLTATDLNDLSGTISSAGVEVEAVIRYNAQPAAARVRRIDGDRVRVDFRRPQAAPAPGQSVVFYRGDRVLGGAVIDAVEPRTAGGDPSYPKEGAERWT